MGNIVLLVSFRHLILSEAGVILSEAKAPWRRFGSFASLRMTMMALAPALR
jgi:hypothetical protein